MAISADRKIAANERVLFIFGYGNREFARFATDNCRLLRMIGISASCVGEGDGTIALRIEEAHRSWEFVDGEMRARDSFIGKEYVSGEKEVRESVINLLGLQRGVRYTKWLEPA